MSGVGPRKRVRTNPSDEPTAGAGVAPVVAPPASEEVPEFWGKGGDPKVFFFEFIAHMNATFEMTRNAEIGEPLLRCKPQDRAADKTGPKSSDQVFRECYDPASGQLYFTVYNVANPAQSISPHLFRGGSAANTKAFVDFLIDFLRAMMLKDILLEHKAGFTIKQSPSRLSGQILFKTHIAPTHAFPVEITNDFKTVDAATGAISFNTGLLLDKFLLGQRAYANLKDDELQCAITLDAIKRDDAVVNVHQSALNASGFATRAYGREALETWFTTSGRRTDPYTRGSVTMRDALEYFASQADEFKLKEAKELLTGVPLQRLATCGLSARVRAAQGRALPLARYASLSQNPAMRSVSATMSPATYRTPMGRMMSAPALPPPPVRSPFHELMARGAERKPDTPRPTSD